MGLHKMRIFDFLSVSHTIDSPEKYAIIGAISVSCGLCGH
jgi:hypothetical protein